jgi:hypothetical protein
VLDDSIFIRVIATNVKGDSLISNEANGAKIIQVPDAPINLQEDTSFRTSSSLGLSWIAGSFDGGSEITGYRLNIAE